MVPTPTPLAHPYTNSHPAQVVARVAKELGFRTRTVKQNGITAYLAGEHSKTKEEYPYDLAQMYVGAGHRVAGMACIYHELVTTNLKHFMNTCATGLLSGTEPASLKAIINGFKPQRWSREPTERHSRVVKIEHGSLAAVLSGCSYGGAPPDAVYSCELIMRPSNEGYPTLRGL